ncbi:hypothetical protein F383_16889 [Gossypium arboreum]|uniref:Uncharacterized protein n=1 Tax=Gossypium arboreum TaxID=29729 RepID=A0A0B0NUF3_GOSAR|nr:hypothetical protein F383_16889 [Gossypium arboreum]
MLRSYIYQSTYTYLSFSNMVYNSNIPESDTNSHNHLFSLNAH